MDQASIDRVRIDWANISAEHCPGSNGGRIELFAKKFVQVQTFSPWSNKGTSCDSVCARSLRKIYTPRNISWQCGDVEVGVSIVQKLLPLLASVHGRLKIFPKMVEFMHQGAVLHKYSHLIA